MVDHQEVLQQMESTDSADLGGVLSYVENGEPVLLSPGCTLRADTGLCTACGEGYVFDSDASLCYACALNCATCNLDDQDHCLTCLDGSYVSAANECVACDAACRTCTTSATQCTACYPK